jgi:colicin import membrane protein
VIDRSPLTVNQPEWDRGLWYMVIASGAVHLLAIVLLLFIPHSFLHSPPRQQSYVVDLVASDQLAGTNMVVGGKGRVEGPPAVSAPPAPKVEPPKPPPPKVEEPKPPEPKPEPAKVEPPQPAPPEVAQKPEPKPEPPKVEEKPKEDEVALAEKVKKAVPPTPPPVVPTPQVKAPPSPKVVAKAVEKPQPPPPPKVDPKAKAAAEKKAAGEAKAAAEAKAAKEAAAARDERIAAAVRRVERQAGTRGGGSGARPGEQTGGPLTVGQGEGAGGTVMGVEYLLYYNLLQKRIKENWAWAGTDHSLEAMVRFNITEAGDVQNVRITHSSGDRSFDASVERAVRALNPLPPPPDAYRKQFADVEVPFSLAQGQQ